MYSAACLSENVARKKFSQVVNVKHEFGKITPCDIQKSSRVLMKTSLAPNHCPCAFKNILLCLRQRKAGKLSAGGVAIRNYYKSKRTLTVLFSQDLFK